MGKIKRRFRIGALLADNGFFSESNVKAIRAAGMEPLLALGREAHHIPLAERLKVVEPPGEQASALEATAYCLKTPEGRALYGRRMSTVEPVFGQIKRVLGFCQFMLRGFERICGEWTLVTMAYNIRRLFQLRGSARRPMPSIAPGNRPSPRAGSMPNRLRAMPNRRPHQLTSVSSFILCVA